MPDRGEVSELDSMISDQGLGLPDKAITDMEPSELILLADEESVAAQLKSQAEAQKPDPTPAAEPAKAPPPVEPTEPAKPAEPGDDAAEKKTNLDQWQDLVTESRGSGEGEDELGRLRAERDRLRRDLDKRNESEIEHARSLLRGEAADDGRGEKTDDGVSVDYAGMVPYFESEYGLDHEQAKRLVPALGRMIEARTRQVVGTEVAPLKKDLEDTKAENVRTDEQTRQAQEITTGMARLAGLGGTATDLVRQYIQTGAGQLWDYLDTDPARMATSHTVYDAGLALTAIIDTAITARESADGGATSLPPDGSPRSQEFDQPKVGKSWEDKIGDELSESAHPFRETIPFLDKDYIQEGK